MAPAPPLPAEPDLSVATMDAECKALLAALEDYRTCPNLEEEDRTWLRDTREFAEQTFSAGAKAQPDKDAQHAIALACHKAADSVRNAHERCNAGPRPKTDDDE